MAKPGATDTKPYFDKEAIADDAAHGGYINLQANSRHGDGSLTTRAATGWAAENGKRHRGTMWWYGAVGNGHTDAELQATGHPARFDLRFARDAITAHCPPGGIVCDPFTGSGTSALAAVLLGRNFIGGDLLEDEHGTPWATVALRVVQPLLSFNDLFG